MNLIKRVSNALAKYAIPDFTGGFTARIGGWEISVPADGWCVTLANTAAGVYTTLPWEYAVTIDFSGDTLVFRDSAGAITADLTIPSDNGEWQESGFMGRGKFGEWYSVRRWEP